MSRGALLAGLVSLAASVGCTTVGWRWRGTIADERDLVVQIEAFVSESSVERPSLDHPAEIAAERLESCLQQIRFRSSRLLRVDETLPVVGGEVTKRLAEALSRGLARAGPAERVRFRVVNTERGMIFSRGSFTSGVAFIDPPGTLNLVFGRVGEALDRDEPQWDQDWGDPTADAGARRGRELVVTGEGTLELSAEGRVLPRWVVFPLSTPATERPPPPRSGG